MLRLRPDQSSSWSRLKTRTEPGQETKYVTEIGPSSELKISHVYLVILGFLAFQFQVVGDGSVSSDIPRMGEWAGCGNKCLSL